MPAGVVGIAGAMIETLIPGGLGALPHPLHAESPFLPKSPGRSDQPVQRAAPAAEAFARPTTRPDAQRGATFAPPLSLQSQTAAQEAAPGEDTHTRSPLAAAERPHGTDELTEEERKEVEELKRRDREVRAHEQAHKSAGGTIAGNPSFETVTGPDGRSYAVSGEVKIDTSPVPNNPDATIRKMEIVKRAALAPAQPSAQDRQVAAEAERKIQQARQEKREQEAEERADKTGNGFPGSAAARLTQSVADRADAAIAQQGTSAQIDPGALLDLVA